MKRVGIEMLRVGDAFTHLGDDFLVSSVTGFSDSVENPLRVVGVPRYGADYYTNTFDAYSGPFGVMENPYEFSVWV